MTLKGTPQAFDPSNSNCTYCGTFGDGLLNTDDGGQTCRCNMKQRTRKSHFGFTVSISTERLALGIIVMHVV
jgi:hypothetical protein